MDWLKERIVKEGVVLSDQVLKLDALLTHQVDPALIMDMGREFATRFKESGVTKVVTLESSGISVAFAAALELGVPMVFARRKNAARRSRRLMRAGAVFHQRHCHGYHGVAPVYRRGR